MQIPLGLFNSFEELVPDEWRTPPTNRAIFIEAHEVQGIADAEFQPLACDLKNVRILFWKGQISHREPVQVQRLWMDSQGGLNIADPGPTRVLKTPDALFTVFLSPFDETPGTNQGELSAQRNIEIAKALLAAVQNRNVIYKKAFENVYSFERKALTA